MAVDVTELMNLAIELHGKGKLADLGVIADSILLEHPKHRGASHLKMCAEHGMQVPFTCIYLHDEARFDIGDFSYGWPRVLIWYLHYKLTIGRFCQIAQDVSIFLSGDHRMDWITGYGFSAFNYGTLFDPAPKNQDFAVSKGPVVIGNDVWIGLGATIMSGVTIGDGAVVAARAVVSKNIAPYEVVAGNPARHVRFRFGDEVIAQLLRIRWWDWPLDKIKTHIGVLNSTDVSALARVTAA
jgi:acetyltransferase-like isoleucine patch superfamily enzyme